MNDNLSDKEDTQGNGGAVFVHLSTKMVYAYVSAFFIGAISLFVDTFIFKDAERLDALINEVEEIQEIVSRFVDQDEINDIRAILAERTRDNIECSRRQRKIEEKIEINHDNHDELHDVVVTFQSAKNQKDAFQDSMIADCIRKTSEY